MEGQSVASYIVTYDLHKSGQNYDGLISAIKAYGTWCKLQQSVWIVVSAKTSVQIRDDLKMHIDSNDKLFVALLAGEAAWTGYTTEISDWIQKNL